MRWARGAAVSCMVGVSLLLSACGTLTEPVEKPYVIDMTKTNSFFPATLVVPKGSTVLWKNRDHRVHSTALMPELALQSNESSTLPALATEGWDSGDVLPGETWEYRFDTPGTYLFTSRSHAEMIGTVIVTE